jgi:hypothetical protein
VASNYHEISGFVNPGQVSNLNHFMFSLGFQGRPNFLNLSRGAGGNEVTSSIMADELTDKLVSVVVPC